MVVENYSSEAPNSEVINLNPPGICKTGTVGVLTLVEFVRNTKMVLFL